MEEVIMSEDSNQLMKQFTQTAMLMHRYQHLKRGTNPHRGQGRILAILKMQPEITQKELSYLLDMRNQSLSELLAKLEKAGYVTRTQSTEDRRVMNIKLTEEGKKAADEMQAEKEDNDLFDILGKEERSNLSSYLEKISEALKKQMGEEDFPKDWGMDDMTPEMIEKLRERGMTPAMFEHLRRGRGPRGMGRGFGRGCSDKE